MTTQPATAATATLAQAAGTVFLALSTGKTYTAKDGNNFLRVLDRKIAADGWARSGYRLVNGVMTAELTRSRLLADYAG